MLISTSAVTFQKAGGQVCYFCDVTAKQPVLRQACYITKSLTKEQTGTAQNKHSVISRYLPPKTLWGFTKAKPPWLPGRRRCPDWVLLECTVITREEEGLEPSEAGTFPSMAWVWMQARPAVSNLSAGSDDLLIPKWSTVPTLLLQTVYSWLEMSLSDWPGGPFGSNLACSGPTILHRTKVKHWRHDSPGGKEEWDKPCDHCKLPNTQSKNKN